MDQHAVAALRLTAPGRGAVATVRVCGPARDCAAAIDAHFQSEVCSAAGDMRVNRIVFGTWHAEDVVVVRTAETCWEIHCHGGEAAVTRIMDGFGNAVPGRAEDGPRLESFLLEELLLTQTQKTAAYVLAQHQGLLRNLFTRMLNESQVTRIEHQISSLLSWKSFARHLTRPWDVAIVGLPNAGKSSLLNAIVGFDRSIVFDQPGTTRDRVEIEIVLDGWPIRLTDTAGIRERTDDTIEASGMSMSRSVLAHCDACCVVIDHTAPVDSDLRSLLHSIPAETPTALLYNKQDLAVPTEFRLRDSEWTRTNVTEIRTSATEGLGIDQVVHWIPQTLVGTVPHPDTPLPVSGFVLTASERILSLCRDLSSPDDIRSVIRTMLQ